MGELQQRPDDGARAVLRGLAVWRDSAPAGAEGRCHPAVELDLLLSEDQRHVRELLNTGPRTH